jgi:hypothetical protein
MKAKYVKSTFYHNVSKRRCNVHNRNANFYIDNVAIPSVIFSMENTPNDTRIFSLERFDKEFSPEFVQ